MTYTERNAGTEAVAWELFLRAGSNERTKGLRRVAGERRKLNSSGVWLMWAGRGWSDARRRRGLRPTTAGRRRRPRHPRVLLFPHKWRLGWGSLCWGSSGGRRWVPKCWQPMITTHSPFPFRGSGEVRDLKYLGLGLRELKGKKEIELRGADTEEQTYTEIGIRRE